MVESTPALKVPVALELPKPDERVFENKFIEKHERKLKTVKIIFGDLNEKNVE